MASLHVASELVKAITNIIYPVGSIYISTNTANPSSYLGGTWQQVAHDCYLIGYNAGNTWFDKPGTSKGSNGNSGSWNTNNHTLTIDQIPSHQHEFLDRKIVWDANTGYNTNIVQDDSYDNKIIQFRPWGTKVGATGGGKGHNHFHISPYYTVVVWRRTA